jgi:cobalt-zinc-cadmium resistance protein CzcA
MRPIVVQASFRGLDLRSFLTEARDRITRDVKLPDGDPIECGGQQENRICAERRLSLVVPLVLF